MAGFRNIDAVAVWQGDAKALETFRKAYTLDCEGDDAAFQKAYAWTNQALAKAKVRAGL